MPKYKRVDKTSYKTDMEFVSELARSLKCSPEEAKTVIDKFTDTIRSHLLKNGFLSIRRFGLFRLAERRNSKMYDHGSKTMIDIPLQRMLKFTPAISWKDEINSIIKRDMLDKIISSNYYKDTQITL